MALKTFILSAGLGTRLRPYTHQIPKPAVPFLGIPMLGYAMYLSHKANVYDLVLNTHLLPQKIKNCVDQLSNNRFRAQFTLEDDKPKGSGGALYYAQEFLKSCEDFYAVNGDAVFIPWRENLFSDMLGIHKTSKAICTLLVSEDARLIQQFNPLWIDEQNVLVGIGEQPKHVVSRPVHYMGAKVFRGDIFKYVPAGTSSLFKDVLFPAIAKGEKVQTVIESCPWWETGDMTSFMQSTEDAMKLIASGEDHKFFEDIYLYFKKSFDFKIIKKENKIQFIHKQSNVDPYSVFGSAFIDSFSTSKTNIKLTDVIINSHAHVNESSSLSMFFKEDKW